MRFFALFILILALTACNLANEAPTTDPIHITIASTSTVLPATNTSSPITTVQSTSTIISITPTIDPNACNTPDSWLRYTIKSGDTLFQIAQLASSTVQDLVDGNCLASANQINVGQVIYLPSEIAGLSPAFSPVYYWLPSDNPVTEDSVRIGCETYITPVPSTSSVTTNPETNIRLALTALFNTTPSANSPYRNHWDDYDLSVDTIAIDASGTATIRIDGDFLLIGVCTDVEIVAQMLMIVFAESEVETAWISVDGMNLKQLSDMSGRTGANAVFTRDDIPLLDN